MAMKEIGSEFWLTERGDFHPNTDTLYLSGRAAFTAILQDLKYKGVKNICVPDYCCESMIEPLIRQNMEFRFYHIHLNSNGVFCTADDFTGCDAVMLVNYFGFMDIEMRRLLQECKHLGIQVVLDQTQAVFSNIDDCMENNYEFGSYRKWTGLEAGFVRRHDNRKLNTWSCSLHGKEYLAKRKNARKLKAEFVFSNCVDESLRETQLSEFTEAEKLLDQEYVSGTDEENKTLLENLNWEKIKTSRKINAKLIYEMLPQLNHCIPIFSTLVDGVVPMAVPILVKEGKRDSLHSYLREQGVFCPVHWPISDLHQNVGFEAKEIYDQELTLVCDQRYNTNDMTRMMKAVMEWERIVSG